MATPFGVAWRNTYDDAATVSTTSLLCATWLLKHRKGQGDGKARRDEHAAPARNREHAELFKTKQGLC